MAIVLVHTSGSRDIHDVVFICTDSLNDMHYYTVEKLHYNAGSYLDNATGINGPCVYVVLNFY